MSTTLSWKLSGATGICCRGLVLSLSVCSYVFIESIFNPSLLPGSDMKSPVLFCKSLLHWFGGLVHKQVAVVDGRFLWIWLRKKLWLKGLLHVCLQLGVGKCAPLHTNLAAYGINSFPRVNVWVSSGPLHAFLGETLLGEVSLRFVSRRCSF